MLKLVSTTKHWLDWVLVGQTWNTFGFMAGSMQKRGAKLRHTLANRRLSLVRGSITWLGLGHVGQYGFNAGVS